MNNQETAYYEGGFQRWHLKLFVIITACMGLIYFTFLKSAWIMNLLSAL